MYLSDHPLRRIADRIAERVDTAHRRAGRSPRRHLRPDRGAIRDLRAFIPRRSTTGQRMAFMTLEDLSGACEVVVFARIFEECAELLRPDQVIVVRGRVQAGRNGRAPAPATQNGAAAAGGGGAPRHRVGERHRRGRVRPRRRPAGRLAAQQPGPAAARPPVRRGCSRPCAASSDATAARPRSWSRCRGRDRWTRSSSATSGGSSPGPPWSARWSCCSATPRTGWRWSASALPSREAAAAAEARSPPRPVQTIPGQSRPTSQSSATLATRNTTR